MSQDNRTSRKLVLWGAIALVAVEVIWVLGANWALGSDLVIGAINKKPYKLEVLWGSAKTWIPGVIHVEDLSVRGTSKRQQWQVELARVRVHLALLTLPFKTFKTYDVVGEDLRFSLDKKSEVAALSAGSARAEAAPTSEPDASQGPEPPATSSSKKSKRPWRFLLHDIHIDGSETIEVLGYSLSGDGSIDANLGLELKGGPLTLERTRLDWTGAELTVEGQRAAHDMALDLEVSLAPFVPKNIRGSEVLGSLSGRIAIQGRTQGAGLVNELLSRFRGFELGSEGGVMDSELYVEEGILGPGSRFELSTANGWIDLVDWRVETALAVDVTVSEEAESGTRLSVAVDDVGVSTPDSEEPLLEGARVSLEALSDGIDFAAGPNELGESFHTIRVALTDAYVADVTRFPIPRFGDFSLDRGEIAVESRFEATPEAAIGGIQIEGQGIDASFGDVALIGDLDIDFRLSSTDPGLRDFVLEESTIDIENVAMTQEGKKAKEQDEDWYARIRLVDGQLQATRPKALNASVEIEMRDTRPLITVFARDKSVMRFFKGMLNFKDLMGIAEMNLVGETTEIRNLDIDSEGLKVKSNLRLGGGTSSGIMWVKFHGINIGLDMRGAKTDVRFKKPLRWYEEQVAAWEPTAVESAVVVPH